MRIEAIGPGRYSVDLPPPISDLLGRLCQELGSLLATPNEVTERLFPAAHTDDPNLQAEFADMMHDDLLRRRYAALDLVEQSLGSSELDQREFDAWMTTTNDLRLTLGTMLDITTEDDEVDIDPDVLERLEAEANDPDLEPDHSPEVEAARHLWQSMIIYEELGFLLELLTRAASEGLALGPDPSADHPDLGNLDW